MAHLSDNCKHLKITRLTAKTETEILDAVQGFTDALILRLPSSVERNCRLEAVDDLVSRIATQLGRNATLVIVGEVLDLVAIHKPLAEFMHYQQWVTVKRKTLRHDAETNSLPNHHFGVTVYTRYKTTLKHTITRIKYTYCPACDKTTKDYGGKKHTYHEYGTSISDVWRDIACDLEDNIEPVIDRFADFLGIDLYERLLVIDLSSLPLSRNVVLSVGHIPSIPDMSNGGISENQLIEGDCLEKLRELPDNSVDFIFVDPPYNLGKKYHGYSDDRAISKYFAWCDTWIAESARVLRPGRTIALLNIPLWSIRHFQALEKLLFFQNWIAWDALSYPVRRIMPAHYAILCFSKGKPRPLPGLNGEAGITESPFTPESFASLEPLAEGFCLRNSCIKRRKQQQINDRGPLTDLWWDIHRVKHNTRRVDHPTQLPPQLMYRLISIFTQPGEIVLDCFNGSGTTTLAAHQLGRQYIGIENSPTYYKLMVNRHEEIRYGLDPFRKEERPLTAKNSPVERLPKRKYAVPKKTLQLEVKRVADELGRLPTREDMIEHGRYPIEYYDEYFISWGEVSAAARTTGMRENRHAEEQDQFDNLPDMQQLRLL